VVPYLILNDKGF